MKQIKIYHEAPLSIFREVQQVTDGDYALVHLLDKDPKYAAQFMDAKAQGREIILDNSAYELGESFDTDKFIKWLITLDPDTYVVPDAPGNAEATLDRFYAWMRNDLPGDKMGVVQGTTVQEIVNCFKQLKSLGADIIGIPFLIGKRLKMTDERLNGTNLSLMYLRAQIIWTIEQYCDPHPIHLLGVALPQEGVYYRKCPWVESVDTSNPVLHGMFGTRYTPGGINEKRSELLADNIHVPVSDSERSDITYNISEFRRMWNR